MQGHCASPVPANLVPQTLARVCGFLLLHIVNSRNNTLCSVKGVLQSHHLCGIVICLYDVVYDHNGHEINNSFMYFVADKKLNLSE